MHCSIPIVGVHKCKWPTVQAGSSVVERTGLPGLSALSGPAGVTLPGYTPPQSYIEPPAESCPGRQLPEVVKHPAPQPVEHKTEEKEKVKTQLCQNEWNKEKATEKRCIYMTGQDSGVFKNAFQTHLHYLPEGHLSEEIEPLTYIFKDVTLDFFRLTLQNT